MKGRADSAEESIRHFEDERENLVAQASPIYVPA